MRLAEVLVDALRKAVNPPVDAIEEHVDVPAGAVRHPQLGAGHAVPQIPLILCPLAVAALPVLPRITEESPQRQRIELPRAILAEHRVLELGNPIFALELQAESMLRILLRQARMATVDTDTAVLRQVDLATVEHLHGHGPLPAPAEIVAHRRARMDIDAARVRIRGVLEEEVLVGDDGHDRNLLQPGLHLLPQRGILGHGRIHHIIRRGAAFDLAVRTPLIRVALRGRTEVQHILEEVAGRSDLGETAVGALLDSPDNRRAGDGQRFLVLDALFGRSTAVEGIVDGAPFRGGRNGQLEGALHQPVRLAERRHLVLQRQGRVVLNRVLLTARQQPTGKYRRRQQQSCRKSSFHSDGLLLNLIIQRYDFSFVRRLFLLAESPTKDISLLR